MFKTKRMSRIVAGVSAALLCLGMASQAQAANGIQAKMDAIFNDMTNVTNPGVYNSQRRGIISGGSIVNRSRIVNEQLFNLSLPNFSANCGGIDAFAGSLSFINAEQFVQLLRSIAANAKGYAFKIALEAASSLIGSTLAELQAVVQKMNDLNVNSCELATGIVNFAVDAASGRAEVGAKLESAMSGLTDVAQSFRNIGTAGNPTKEIIEKAKKDPALQKRLDNLYGNIMWKELKRQNVKGMLLSPDASENQEYWIIMSITGTRVVTEPMENESAPKTANSTDIPYSHVIQPEDLLEGGTFKIYSCSDDECLNPKEHMKTITVQSLPQRILQALLGNGSTTGIIAKYRTGQPFSDEEQKIMNGMPSDAGMIISNLSLNSPEIAKSFATKIAYAVAMNYVFEMTKDYIMTARYAISASQMVNRDAMTADMDKRAIDIEQRYLNYAQSHTTLNKLLQEYNAVALNLRQMPADINIQVAKNGNSTR